MLATMGYIVPEYFRFPGRDMSGEVRNSRNSKCSKTFYYITCHRFVCSMGPTRVQFLAEK